MLRMTFPHFRAIPVLVGVPPRTGLHWPHRPRPTAA